MTDVAEQIDLPSGFEKAKAAVRDELGDIMKEAQREMLRVIDVKGTKATGDLETSIQWHVEATARALRGVAGADAKPGSNIAPYAHWVDQPTRPHWPPIKPLERWARSKFGATGNEKTSIAYGAAWSIARRGTSGARFTDAAWRELRNEDITGRLESVVADALTN